MKTATFTLLSGLLVFNCSVLQAQWVQANGNSFVGPVSAFAVIPDGAGNSDLIAGSIEGVFLSTDNGTNWTSVNTGLANTSVRVLALSGTNLFAAGTYGGVYLSTDSGRNWAAASTPFRWFSQMVEMGTNLFAAAGNVYLSTDNGTTWTAAVDSGLTTPDVTTLAAGGTNLFAGTSDRGGVFLSTNDGTSWTEVDRGLTSATDTVFSLAVSGTNLIASTSAGVFLSTNYGTSWTLTGLANIHVCSFAVSGPDLFAGTYGAGVFLSTDNGTSWTAVNSGLTNAFVVPLAVNDNCLFAGTANGVFLSTNEGKSWKAPEPNLRNTYVNAFAASPDAAGGTNLFVATYDGVFLSTNNGARWTRVDSGLSNRFVRCLATNPNGTGGTNLPAGQASLFAGTEGGLFLSTDNGTSWTAVDSGLTNLDVRALITSPNGAGGTNLFAASDEPGYYGYISSGVYISTNGGESWTSTGMDSILTVSFAVTPDGTGGTNLFAGTAHGVYLSTNDGISWSLASEGLPKSPNDSLVFESVSYFAVSGRNLFANTVYDGVFLSTNNGTSWTAVNTGLTSTYVFSLAVSGTNVFAGTDSGGVFLSTNNGASWTAVSAGLTNTYVSSLTVSGTDLFAGTLGRGVWKRPLSEMITSEERPLSEAPTHFRLEQNYPNPFNPITTIRFAVRSSRCVELRVYDVLGREVATLVNEMKHAGSYTVNWDASRFASGVYFYRLKVGNFIETKKLILLK